MTNEGRRNSREGDSGGDLVFYCNTIMTDVWPKTIPKEKHPLYIQHPEPIRISPLLRFARWSALGLGISYGFIRLRMLSKYHADIREWEVQKIIHKKTEQKKDALRVLREQNEWIMKITDMNLEEGKSQLGVEHLYDLK
uniref:ATP synthase F(0) complex subunit e, mitochondrial n=1 Tax=Globodera pallida TaxID=36090 RepID=A0A183C2C9_GLOPA